jgi:Zinc carboxypeptidase
MTRKTSLGFLFAGLIAVLAGGFLHAQQSKWAPDPKQPVDEEYTRKIKEYTTAPYFLSPLVDYLPASKTVPTPKAIIGDIAGAPGKLPYTAQVHEYMRALEKASPRVKVFSIGKTEEGREMIAVAIADAPLIAKLDENRARLAKLADPRSIKLDDAEADRLVAASTPIYYISGTIHSPETGAPTALMELAYRLAVDDAPYIKAIRANVITMITPVVEADGRDRQADIYNWHLAHPKDNVPPLVYWGKYLVHDNNRDAMGATLALTRNVINAFVDQKAQLLHDLHESVPFLYDNTVGDGPYNAWVDPILTDEWQLIGWNNMSEMTKLGMPGAFTHGQFDTWSPGYLMFIAAMHNGTSRLYETFGNGGADTVERTLRPSEYSRTWYRQNPPLPKVLWSQRNNNNYIETGILTSLSYYASNNKLFLKNFYLKAKRSVLKATTEGPAAYVFPADDPHPGLQADLLQVLQTQRCEISRATAPFSVTLPAKKKTARPGDASGEPANAAAKSDEKTTEIKQFPAGSYIVRMDQPYSRIADALLDYQYWSPSDPQKSPYDDTGWTFGELFNVQVVRVVDRKVLDAGMEPVNGEVKAASAVDGTGTVYLVNNDTDPNLFALRYRLKDAAFEAAEEPFEAAGHKFARGSFLIKGSPAGDVQKAAADLGLRVYATASAPAVKTHAVKVPRIGYVHTWLGTQDEGWWRQELDLLKVPYEYISTQTVATTPNLNAKYDVILFPPVGRSPAQVVAGMPMWGNPLPWKTTALTPNLGKLDSTDDMRPGLGFGGLANLDAFVRNGGLLVTTDDTSELAVGYGLTQGVSTQRSQRLKVPGSVVRSRFVDLASPVAYGYDENLSVYLSDGLILSVSNTLGGRGGRFGGDSDRPTGRGTVDDPDVPQGRPYEAPPADPKVEPWQASPVTDEQLRNAISVIPVKQRPRVILRYGDSKDLLVSGLLEGGSDIAQRPAVVDVPHDKGHVLVFSPNPIWRGETKGSYAMVFNAILHFDHLDAGRKWDEK